MKKLYRSTRDKKLFGLCGGLAEAINVDATLLRILAIVLAVFTSGGFILVYLLAALVVPKEPPYYNPYGPGPGGYHPPGGGYYNPHQGGSWGDWQDPGHTAGPGPYGRYDSASRPQHQPPPRPEDLDSMMDDLEKKALRKEIEELKAKLSKLEKGE